MPDAIAIGVNCSQVGETRVQERPGGGGGERDVKTCARDRSGREGGTFPSDPAGFAAVAGQS